ncbi:Transglutaminase-like enzyme, putative cysteine protease [Poseidonocella pacifica]|uniref:Transglutaminase-like enzyme, putative cysteine protease n=1 Tax=Poseidonocella pacifica TaxID=871651 RepID=A0A1I0Y4R6_9RHOB|nr:transglutaminase domain-containing protein [Poseidonocella pacifica]SFB07847.1 Transglutaminase-like enzyme, putative cysteine protease [Poseidonocella pacifica]
MQLNRRLLMKSGIAAAAAFTLPRSGEAAFNPSPSGWRRFELTTRIDLPQNDGPAQVWVPVPSISEGDWMRAEPASWTGNADDVVLRSDPASGARFVHARWSSTVESRTLQVVATAAAQDRVTDLSNTAAPVPLTEYERAYYTAPTALIPTDGIVAETSRSIVGNARSDLEKARRLYDWVVENSARNPETRGCGLGDVATMLHAGDLSGKCADLNALYVGLARAAGLPARDVYGIRVAPSAFGYKSLGAGSQNVTKAQHCRADVYLGGFGWVAADPADVRKVMLEEPPEPRPLGHPQVEAVRETLFGAWEGNWVGFNFAHDVPLPGASTDPEPFLMYPEAEVAGARLDALDPGSFAYTITARQL